MRKPVFDPVLAAAASNHQLSAPQRSRRHFLGVSAGLGLAGSGLVLGFSLSARGAGMQTPSATPVIAGDGSVTPPSSEFAPNAFLRIDRAGQVTLVIPKVEMGQGVYTSIPMLVAEELEVGLDQVQIEHAPPDAALYSDPNLGGQLTGGSTSIRYAWMPLRQAGATARSMLISAAAQQWKVDPGSCHAERGEVVHAPSSRRLAYGALVEAAARLPAPPGVALKDPNNFKLIGTRAKRLDSPGKVDGTAQFGIDVRLPGMQYAVIVGCPVLGGSLGAVDDSVTRTLPGVTQVVHLDNAVAVVGVHTWAAKRGAAALRITWNDAKSRTLQMKDLIADLAQALA